MTVFEFSDWLSATAPSQAIQVHSWAIPSIQTTHIISLAVLFSSALMVDLRVLGSGLRSEPLQAVAQRFLPALWGALLVLLVTGTLLIIAEPGRTLGNPAFYFKMTCLVLAIIVTLWLQRFSRSSRPVTGLPVALACVSLALWAAIIVSGRLIAYIEAK